MTSSLAQQDVAAQSSLTAGPVSALLTRLPARLERVMPAPSASGRAFWSGLSDDLKRTLLARGEAALVSWPDLPDTLYQVYSQTGDRASFETPYFARRRQLNALALSECVADDGNFLPDIAKGIAMLCDEAGWQLPAHNSYVRGGPRAPLPDPENPVIDLFAAETGALLAVLAGVLGERLDPAVAGRIETEVTHRIITPYLTRHFWWMGAGDEKMNNWTAWCSENVLRATFALDLPQETRRAVLVKAAGSLDAFLKDYAEDGACEEGPMYFRRAGLCLWGALDVMDSATAGAFAPIWTLPKLHNIGAFAVHTRIAGRAVVNFSDCAPVAEPADGREFRFAERIGLTDLAALAVADRALRPAVDLPDDINLAYRLIDLAAEAEMAAYQADSFVPADHFYESIGLLVARDDTFTLAVKAGDNGSDHNHNDVGNVILYRGEVPILLDLGVGTYTKQTFSSERYDIWTMQSAWHNLPDFDGMMQQEGVAFGARDVTVNLTDSVAEITMDLAHSYPESAGVRHYQRQVRLIKGKGAEIEDRHEGTAQAVLSLIFASKPERQAKGLRLINGECIALEGADSVCIESIDLNDQRLIDGWGAQIFRARIPFTESLKVWIAEGEAS